MVDAGDAGRPAGDFSFANLEAVRRGDLVLTASERRYVMGLYDGGVAYADRALGRLLESYGVAGPPLEIFDLASDSAEGHSLAPQAWAADPLVTMLVARVQRARGGGAPLRPEPARVPHAIADQ